MTDQLSNQDYLEIFRAAPDGILVVDANGEIIEANPQACRLFGYEAERLRGERIELLVPDHLRAGHAAYREQYSEQPRARPMGIGLELSGRRSDGHEFPVEISLSPRITDEGLYVICAVRDVTEQRRYREFSRATLRAAEDERKRLALELHDDMAQRLAAMLLRVRLASETKTRKRRVTLLAELREELVDAAAALHRIAQGLRPPALTEAGLEAAIRSAVRSHLADAGLDLELDVESVDDRLDEDQKLVLYRVVQEAISNVVRHAEASHLSIRVRLEGERIIGEVEDDGRGFVVEEVDVLAGRLGLLGMRERAASVGAHLSIESELAEGTRVAVDLPARTAEADAEERVSKAINV